MCFGYHAACHLTSSAELEGTQCLKPTDAYTLQNQTTLGAGNAASVRQPTLTPIRAGSASAEYQTVEPHWGQKWNIAPPPRLTQLRYSSLSASSFGTFHDVEAPWISTCSFGKRACTAKTFPDCLWHRWQWHKLIRSGSGPVIFKVSCPQLHVASRFSAFFVPLRIALAERPDLSITVATWSSFNMRGTKTW